MTRKTHPSAISLAAIAVLALAACAPATEAPAETAETPAKNLEAAAAPRAGGKLYGTELALAESTPLADLMAKPAEFVGKTVQITGTAVHVCKHSGKRLRLMDPATKAAIMVDFAAAGLEFPAETLNHKIVAEGRLTRRDLGAPPKEAEHDKAAADPEKGGEDCAAEEADANEANHVYVIEGTRARDLDLAS